MVSDYQQDTRRKVLFLCTGNSCRSQMAEVIVNTIMGDDWLAVSAGTKPTGNIHPKAIEVLEEIFHSGKSKSVGLYKDWKLELIVTVCDQAAEECPRGYLEVSKLISDLPIQG